jgi:hypothetical protein
MKIIIQNEVKCTRCNDIIWSAHRHDFVGCKCGAPAVDGGTEYLRRVGDMSVAEDRSMRMEKDALEACKQAVKWGNETGRNELGIALAVIRALRDHNLLDMKKFS